MIRSTFAAFVTAYSGLQASQKALDVTGHNISNVDTAGYTRQRLDLLSVSSGGYTNRYAFAKSTEIGQGVNVSGVSQVRDPFLDVRFRRENAQLGETGMEHSVLTSIEDIMDEFIAAGGLSKGFDGLITQLQNLSKNTGNTEFDGIVRSSADLLCKLFNEYSNQINTVREQYEYELSDIDVPRVNTILKNIAELNKNIRTDQVYGNPSLELQDQRNLLIDELSQYMKVDVKYSPIEISKGIFVDDVDIRLITDGPPQQLTDLMHNMDYVAFSSATDPATHESSISITPWGGGAAQDITDKITSGSFKGVLDMLNKSGPLDTPASDERGIGYYTGMLDTLAAKFVDVMNAANSYLNPAYDPTDPSSQQFLTDHPLFENRNTGDATGVTAANLSVAQGWLKSEYGVTNTKVALTGNTSGANDNILYILSQFETKFSFTAPNGDALFTGTFQEFQGQLRNTLALDVNNKNSVSTNHMTVLSTIMDLKEGVSSVHLDEEGINLIRYQKSYNASARFMTTLDEALDKLINGTGIVGR